jgi:hypothetical protein
MAGAPSVPNSLLKAIEAAGAANLAPDEPRQWPLRYANEDLAAAPVTQPENERRGHLTLTPPLISIGQTRVSPGLNT